jgi:hypothetical protein
MSSVGRPHFEANGDVYFYYWCKYCDDEYEVVEDALYGGEPSVKKI